MVNNEPTHGGKREGAGRRPVAPEDRLDHVFSVKLTASEKELLDSADVKKWARETLVRTAKRRLKH